MAGLTMVSTLLSLGLIVAVLLVTILTSMYAGRAARSPASAEAAG